MRYTLSLLLSLTLFCCRAQTYISLAPSLTNTAGTLADKSNIALELGRQWDVFSLGIDFGKTSMAKVTGRDTTAYLELRPNLNVFQQGKFTNTFTAGIGYIFNAEENLMTELTSGIEYAYNPKLHFNISFGQYYYSGRYSASNVTFFGVSAMWYFTATNTGSLIKPVVKGGN
ncbi:MAG TPA: hypothetical protein VGM41_21980 [Chitinophagaceae bacterium]|jgi:hypothetical protein